MAILRHASQRTLACLRVAALVLLAVTAALLLFFSSNSWYSSSSTTSGTALRSLVASSPGPTFAVYTTGWLAQGDPVRSCSESRRCRFRFESAACPTGAAQAPACNRLDVQKFTTAVSTVSTSLQSSLTGTSSQLCSCMLSSMQAYIATFLCYTHQLAKVEALVRIMAVSAALSSLPFLAQDPKSIKMHNRLMWVKNLLVSRVYNPTLNIAALVDKAAAVEAHPTAGPALRAANIRVLSMDQYTQPGSRAAQLVADGPSFFQRCYSKFKPGDRCAQPGACKAEGRLGDLINWLARFCQSADLAAADGADYVLTMDADAGLVQDLAAQLAPRMLETHILTFVEWSSQAVFWKREALDAFCDALVVQFRPDTDPLVRCWQLELCTCHGRGVYLAVGCVEDSAAAGPGQRQPPPGQVSSFPSTLPPSLPPHFLS